MPEIPLFPLNTVLFPGIPLHLHIFEERYRLMIQDCVSNNLSFGVVLIRKGSEALGKLAEPHLIGCTARILQVDTLEDGRMNILVLGDTRFRILDLNESKPYLQGEVELLPPADLNLLEDEGEMDQLLGYVREYIDLIGEIVPGDMDISSIQFPDDPAVNLYLSASVLQLPDGEKQVLLSFEDTEELLDQLFRLYKRELSVLHSLRDISRKEGRRLARLN